MNCSPFSKLRSGEYGPLCGLVGRLRRGIIGMVLLALLAGCRNFPSPQESYVGPQLPPNPTFEQIASFINTNSTQIRTVVADQASLSSPGFPTLRSQILFERPWRLRIRGETSLSGLELDVGSNDELFWFWVKRNEPPAFYFCRYSDYDNPASTARRVVPIDPRWLIEAVGITELDVNAPHEGPVPLAGGRLEIRTQRPTPDGIMTKVTVVDAQYGLILAQYLYDPQGRLVASAVSYDHRREPVTGLVLARTVEINVPASGMVLRLNLGNARINEPIPNPSLTWNMPVYPGYPMVNLADPRNLSGISVVACPSRGTAQGPVAPFTGVEGGSGQGLTWLPIPQ
ncbi:MAG: hypothetical protein WBH86_14575 [Thermogutta sp.]|nr:hypothetical protein [Thermogutta sp.]